MESLAKHRMHHCSQSWIWNGTQFIPCDGVPMADRGFRYGMALFESVAIRGGRVEFLEAHLARIEAAALRCDWPLDPTILASAGMALQQVPSPAFARIYVTAGDGGPDSPVTSPRVFLFVEPRETPPMQPLRVGFHPEPFLPLLGGLKTANYWANLEALRMARASGWAEALLFNPQSELISACMANAFVQVDSQWVTPPIASGARTGVVREWVMQQREVAERVLTREDLRRTTACFLTSSWAGVVPVASLEGRPLETSLADALRAVFFPNPF